MPPLRIAAAQSVSVPGDVAANVEMHCRFIVEAATAGIDVLVFPELSLSGYELPLLRTCAVQPADAVLAPIRELVCSTGMTVVVGAPVLLGTQRARIGAITFFPGGQTAIYCKQYLHPGEEVFAEPGELGSPVHKICGETCAVAICADTAHTEHAQAASDAGASVYLASVLVSEAGYPTDSALLRSYATRHGMATLVSNHGGPTGGYLVVASRSMDGWSGELISIGT
jgi:predicted amidohydrolase